MILEQELENVIEKQNKLILSKDFGLKREFIPSTKSLSSHALIISGIRRCGKSTLLYQMIKELTNTQYLFINFESPQLFSFSVNDFVRLDNIITRLGIKSLFLDELQLVDKWELYVRQKLDEGYKVIITGSNSSMLSNELGTKITGRYIPQELFPFSFSEFISFFGLSASTESLSKYNLKGGFPEYLKSGDDTQLITLFDDIIFRDIVARFGIKEIKSLQKLAYFLISNIGNRITATKLKQPLSISSTSTIINWISYLEMSYLFFLLPQYSQSIKAQQINPRKIYAIDLGLVNVIKSSESEDLGYKLENLIYLHLRRKYRELYYFDNKGKSECDFVAISKGEVTELIQVCYTLTPDNLQREINGLIDAMKFFNKKHSIIVTFDTKDKIIEKEFSIDIIPAYEYLTY